MKNIPVLSVHGKTIAETYEHALVKLYNEGARFKTQYDKPDDPESIDATMNITIDEPLTDPMIHKAFPGGIEDLREYVMELQGVKDHWCKNLNDPEDTRWEYTYHGRFKNYGQWKGGYIIGQSNDGDIYDPNSSEIQGPFCIDQIEAVIDKLCKQPFSRQAQIITWMPNLDLTIYDPPCLQSMWFRIMEDEDGEYWLNTNIRIRSNDAWGAYFMNIFGLTMFIKEQIADVIAERTNKKVNLARINWQADSWHIYGKDIKQAKQRLFNRITSTKFDERVYDFNDETIQEIYNEATPVIEEKIRVETEKMEKKDG